MKSNHNLNNIDLVILAGGKGSRIKKFLGNYPKPMIKFNNKNFIQYVINDFSKYNFNRILILCGYRSKFLFNKYHNKKINLTNIICIKEKNLLGTGGALFNLKKFKVKDFVLVNGDTIFNINIQNLISSLKDKKNFIGIIALTKNKNQKSEKLNNIYLKNGLLSLRKKSPLMNGGVYFFKKRIFKYIFKKKTSLENDILPILIKKKKIKGKFFDNFFLDIGSKFFIKKATKIIKKQFTRPAAFLDRDGVINYDFGYVHKINSFKFKNGVINGLKYLKKKKYYIFIITNQAGIGKKIYSEQDFIFLHKQLNKRLSKLNIFIDDVQYSPYHPNAKIKKYKKISLMRKPGNKMIENIKSNWDLDLQNSFMIGDKITDKKAAHKSNLKFYYAENNFYKQIKEIINNY